MNQLRVEVERLQPKPTSNHRRPRVQLPEDLRRTSHVFIRRGGVQPSLSTPYTGPYRVVSREPTHFRVEIPGRGTESVALARLKPAHMPEEDGTQEEEVQTPPSPPPPGRRPGLRTRRPAPTDRVTRRQGAPTEVPVPSPQRQGTPRASTPAGAQPPEAAPEPQEDPPEGTNEPFRQEEDQQPLPQEEQPEEQQQQPPRRPLRFTRPEERRFSTRGPRINYAAPLKAILKQQSIIQKD